MEYMKEKAKEMAASARAGMQKTEATAEEKVEKMKTRDPEGKPAAAEERREDRMNKAEAEKQAAVTKLQGLEEHPSNPPEEHKLARTDGDRIATDPI